MTPNQLATKLVGNGDAERYGKAFVRPFLRRHFTRDNAVKGSGWTLTDEQVAAVTAAHKARAAGKAFDFDAWRKARRAAKRNVAATPAPIDPA